VYTGWEKTASLKLLSINYLRQISNQNIITYLASKYSIAFTLMRVGMRKS